MPYNWDQVPDNDFEKLPIGRQNLINYFVDESENSNGKPYLQFKFARPEDVDVENLSYDDHDRPKVYPNGFLNVYFETDFGKKILKQLLKALFGEQRLKEFDTNEKIIHAVDKGMPVVSGLVNIEVDDQGNEYSKLKELEFKAVHKENATEHVADVNSSQNTTSIDKDEQVSNDDDDDLPF